MPASGEVDVARLPAVHRRAKEGGGREGAAGVQAELRAASDGSVPLKYLVAGGVAGGVSRTAVAPLSRIKVLVQVQSGAAARQSGGYLAMLRRIVKLEGPRGLFVGNGADCLRIVPHSAAKFLFYEQLSHAAHSYAAAAGLGDRWQPALRMAAGAAAGIVAGTITYPLDMIRGRLMVQGPNGLSASALHRREHYKGVVDAARTIARREGVHTFYRGWLPSFFGTVLYSGLKFSVYETLKDAAVRHYGLRDDRQLGVGVTLAAGAIAGGVGQSVAYPLEVVRRRLQAGDWAPRAVRDAAGREVMHYPGMMGCLRQLLRDEGLGALYRGLSLNYLRVIPAVAISFATYDAMKDMLGLPGARRDASRAWADELEGAEAPQRGSAPASLAQLSRDL